MKKVRKIDLRLITEIEHKHQLRILNIRNEEDVRDWMYTDHIISEEEHFLWIENLKKSTKHIVFAVMEEHIPIGVISVNDINRKHSHSDWAFYLESSVRGGIGAALEYSFLDFIFNSLNLQKLNCEVLEGNAGVLKLHSKFLFEKEGLRKSNIVKKEQRIGVHLLGLTRDIWNQNKSDVFKTYKSTLEKFHVNIHWN